MKVNSLTKEALRCRRIRRMLLADGYEEIGEGGGKLWELHRGARQHHVIIDVKTAPEGKSVFIKTAAVRQSHVPAGTVPTAAAVPA